MTGARRDPIVAAKARALVRVEVLEADLAHAKAELVRAEVAEIVAGVELPARGRIAYQATLLADGWSVRITSVLDEAGRTIATFDHKLSVRMHPDHLPMRTHDGRLDADLLAAWTAKHAS